MGGKGTPGAFQKIKGLSPRRGSPSKTLRAAERCDGGGPAVQHMRTLECSPLRLQERDCFSLNVISPVLTRTFDETQWKPSLPLEAFCEPSRLGWNTPVLCPQITLFLLSPTSHCNDMFMCFFSLLVWP